jgi:CheY-like chemotaxis protein
MARILVVDDDPVFAAMLSFDLLRSGHRPMVARDARSALAALESNARIEVVVTDIMMPDMDGIELVRAIRARSLVLPIVALSSGGARLFPNVLSAARALGADRALYKPVSATIIGSTIRDLLKMGHGALAIDGTASVETCAPACDPMTSKGNA